MSIIGLTAAGVIQSDTLPAGAIPQGGFEARRPSGERPLTVGGRAQLVWNVGTVAAGATGQIAFVLVLPQNTPAGQLVA